MVVIVEYPFLIFNKKDIFLSEFPYDNNDDFDVVTFYFCRNRINLPGYKCEEQITSIIDLKQETEEIWNKMDRGIRQKIKKAPKKNIDWKINENFDEFHTISKEFMRDKKITPLFGAFLNLDVPTVKIMKKYMTLFTAELNGEVLCGNLYLEDDENILVWISTSKRLAADKETSKLISHANSLLHWQAINYAKEKSIKRFNWGGLFSMKDALDPKKNSINNYKLSYGGQIEPTYFYRKINNKLYKKLSYIYTKLNKEL